MKRVGIYQLKDRIFMHPWQLTDVGVGVATEPYTALPLAVNSAELGESAMDALSQSGRTVPHPADWKKHGARRLKAAGVKSEKAFQAHARYVCVRLRDKQLLVEPSRNGGTKGDSRGFEPLLDCTVILDADLPVADLGDAIREGLRTSREQSNP